MSELDELRAENQRLRERLSELESRMDLVLEATNDGVWDWNLQTDNAYFSPRWKALLGYAEDEVEDTGAAFFALLHPKDQAKVEAAVNGHLEGREPYLVEFRMRSKSGGWVEIQARGQAIWDEQGAPVRMAGVHTDVSERHRRERERLRNEALISIQSETIRALGVPILQVWPGVLCLPVVGTVDEERAMDMTSALLDRVAASSSHFAVLDLTGADFEVETAQYLARMIRCLGLIGAQGVLCGISPETAGVFVELDVTLDDVPIYRDLGDALRACLLELEHRDR